jgi:hypothetical protein
VSPQFFSGPYRHDAPDLLIGWEAATAQLGCAVGRVTDSVFSDNTKSWSGDHCVDPSIVPGVLCRIACSSKEEPRLIDIPRP